MKRSKLSITIDHGVSKISNLIISFVFLFSFTTTQIQTVLNEENGQVITIDQYEKDITGNGLNEKIELKGVLLTKDENYYQDIWAEITSEHNETWTIPYLGGYDPEIQFITFSNKKEQSIFYHSKQSEKQHDEKASLHTISNGKLIEEQLPNYLAMSGLFKDHFFVRFSIHDELDPIILQISDKEPYEQMYTKKGHLRQSTAILTNKNASLEPTYISASKQYGLKSVQQVYHEETNEGLGAIETLWYYENNKWIKLKDRWLSQ